MSSNMIFARGQPVRITYEGHTVQGTVELCSPNGNALFLSFEAILGVFAGTMPVTQEYGVFRDLIYKKEVRVELQTSDAVMATDRLKATKVEACTAALELYQKKLEEGLLALKPSEEEIRESFRNNTHHRVSIMFLGTVAVAVQARWDFDSRPEVVEAVMRSNKGPAS
jgi:hypothetical protein